MKYTELIFNHEFGFTTKHNTFWTFQYISVRTMKTIYKNISFKVKYFDKKIKKPKKFKVQSTVNVVQIHFQNYNRIVLFNAITKIVYDVFYQNSIGLQRHNVIFHCALSAETKKSQESLFCSLTHSIGFHSWEIVLK